MSDTLVMAAVSHPADAFPSVLAVAEAEGLTGQDLLLATAVIYEVQCRFVDVVPYNHHGWDQTPVVALGAALGCGRLLGLTDEQMYHALALAVTPNLALNQTRTGKLSMWKGMAGPQGARAGVFAAYLARAGMTGPDGVFEGKYGLWKQMMGGETFDLPLPADFTNHTFAVQQTGIKSFPTRFNCQVPVFTAQKLRGMVDVKDIISLKIESIRQAFDRWVDLPEIWKPETRETADHSLPATVAMGLLDGTITPGMMDTGRFKDQDVLDLIAKCKIELPDEFADLAPETRCCRLTAIMKDGKTVVAEYRRSLADDVADPGWDQAVDKFVSLTKNMLDAGVQKKLLAFVRNLEKKKSVVPLIRMTKVSQH
jgi:2-methylcitrate dehydratase